MTDDLRGTLDRVGDRFNLGEYEIDAYLAVLEHGELTASDIADRTDIPQPRVYDTVRSLSDRGLVELRESRPMKIVAVDPDDAFVTSSRRSRRWSTSWKPATPHLPARLRRCRW